uniref:Uncharacterized protein n=1 Tax=Anguilla anguilla TaxID=7936 RepID=A0A0E9XX99_ANGAN
MCDAWVGYLQGWLRVVPHLLLAALSPFLVQFGLIDNSFVQWVRV